MGEKEAINKNGKKEKGKNIRKGIQQEDILQPKKSLKE